VSKEFEIKGMDELLKNLKDLESNPQILLAGKTFEIEKEVECEHCGCKQKAILPVQVERVEGNKGYGPGGSITVVCINPECGKSFEVTWDNVVFDIELTE
jgi:hypothetical protein